MKRFSLILVFIPSVALADVHSVPISDSWVASACQLSYALAAVASPQASTSALKTAAGFCSEIQQSWAAAPEYVQPKAKAKKK